MLRTQSLLCRRRTYLWLLCVVFLPSCFSRCQEPDHARIPAPDAPASQPTETKGFLARWGQFYRQDWAGTAASSPVPPRRGLPSPLDSPPFPNADWPYGGSPVIGEPDTNSYPLMTAINSARSRTKLYGWIGPSLNFSTSSHLNLPEANDLYSNRLEMNQIVLFAERLPDSVQRNHIDWGYHLTALYGTDYRFTLAKGYLSGQLLDDHRQYGFDPTLEYLDVYSVASRAPLSRATVSRSIGGVSGSSPAKSVPSARPTRALMLARTMRRLCCSSG